MTQIHKSISTLDLTNHVKYQYPYPQPIDAGGYSDIYKGDVHGIPVAVKVLKTIGINDESMRETLTRRVDRELRIWSKISHENVLEFLGLCLFWRPNRPLSEGALLSLVSPWMKNGTSTQYLRNNPDVDRLDIVIGAYHGLSHLHSKGIIHGDIKGGNLLISDSGDPVLADFGLAVFAEKDDIISSTTWFSHSDSGLRGTSRWMSPELLNPGASSSYESDVWGFGCLILEIMLTVPYPTCRNDLQVLPSILKGTPPYQCQPPEDDELGPTPFEKYPGLWKLCKRCWIQDPASRITMGEIGRILCDIRKPPSTRRDPVATSTSTLTAAGTKSHPAPLTSLSGNPLRETTPLNDPEIAAQEARVRIKKRTLGMDDLETISAMDRLAMEYYDLQRFDEAETLLREVIESRKRVQSEYNAETLTSMHQLELTLYCKARYTECEELGVKLIEAKKLVLGEDHQHTIASMYNLGLTYLTVGKLSEAEGMYKTVVEKGIRLYGPDSKDAIMAASRLALVYNRQGRLTEAADLGGDVVERRRRLYGDKDTETRDTMEDLMVTYIKLGRQKEADELENILSQPL